ncbi:hypothetical protein PIB30_087385 [Stylosanthes scabra]|uniref:Uncharacterized protein n=1 Tax=Stylosanthes scabra TaxID=79078 RepID=A0ABU6VUK4_9FABA|nr:hypothetical protein [Stylosanthes scabra]
MSSVASLRKLVGSRFDSTVRKSASLTVPKRFSFWRFQGVNRAIFETSRRLNRFDRSVQTCFQNHGFTSLFLFKKTASADLQKLAINLLLPDLCCLWAALPDFFFVWVLPHQGDLASCLESHILLLYNNLLAFRLVVATTIVCTTWEVMNAIE